MRRLLFAALIVGGLLSATSGPVAGQEPERRDRWQVTLRTAKILYEVQPVDLRGDHLVLRNRGETLRVPLTEITELRWVRPTYVLAGGGIRSARGSLVGADDVVFEMTLLEVPERRALVTRILATLTAPGNAD